MTYRSRQGINVAFIGTVKNAQTACAEHLKWKHEFKRLEFDDPIRKFIRKSYGYKPWTNINWQKRLEFYDSIYRVDNDFFINIMRQKIQNSEVDIVISDVRYINELDALREMDFKIVRVTSAKPMTGYPQVGKYVKTAEVGSVPVALYFDSNRTFQGKIDYSIYWESRTKMPDVLDPLLERMGYNLDK